MEFQQILSLLPFFIHLNISQNAVKNKDVIFHDSTLYEGDFCKLDSDYYGVCSLIKDCPEYRLLNGRGQRMQNICSFFLNQPIICCPKSFQQFENQFTTVVNPQNLQNNGVHNFVKNSPQKSPDYFQQELPRVFEQPIPQKRPQFFEQPLPKLFEQPIPQKRPALFEQEIPKVFEQPIPQKRPDFVEQELPKILVQPIPQKRPDYIGQDTPNYANKNDSNNVHPEKHIVTNVDVSIWSLDTVNFNSEQDFALPDEKLEAKIKALYKILEENNKKYDRLPFGKASREKCSEYVQDICPIQRYVVGGSLVVPFEFGHSAAIGYFDKTDNEIKWRCGGTIISENYILTAAHCLFSIQWGPAAWVRIGDLNLTDNNDAMPRNYKIIERIKHPLYKKSSYYHDIGILKLDEKIQFNDWVRPACLLMEEKPEETIGNATATGWGKLYADDADGTDALMKVRLPLVNYEHCNQFYKDNRALSNGIVSEWQICAGMPGKDTCQGDSGGPLFTYVYSQRCIYSIMGITSFGSFCGHNIPAVYTRIFHYISWIENEVWPEKARFYNSH